MHLFPSLQGYIHILILLTHTIKSILLYKYLKITGTQHITAVTRFILLRIQTHCRDKIATGSFDKTCKLWSSETGKCFHTFTGHTAEIVSVPQLSMCSCCINPRPLSCPQNPAHNPRPLFCKQNRPQSLLIFHEIDFSVNKFTQIINVIVVIWCKLEFKKQF